MKRTAPLSTRRKAIVLDIPERGPIRLPEYRAWVKAQPCIFCGRTALAGLVTIDPHHIDRSRGMGVQCDDTKIVPVCRSAHMAIENRNPKWICSTLGELFDMEAIERHVWRKALDTLTAYVRTTGGVLR